MVDAVELCHQLPPQSWNPMIRSHLGFIVDLFFLVPEEGQACYY